MTGSKFQSMVVPGGPASMEHLGNTIEKGDTISAIDPDSKSGLKQVSGHSVLQGLSARNHRYRDRNASLCSCLNPQIAMQATTNVIIALIAMQATTKNVIELLRGKDVIGTPLIIEVIKRATLERVQFHLKRADYRSAIHGLGHPPSEVRLSRQQECTHTQLS